MQQSVPILCVEGLDAGYGTTQVLRDVSFSVAVGESVAIVGANGVGKTTLLRTISGLLTPTKGRIRFCGQDVTGWSSADLVTRGLSQSPEGRRVFSGLTVEDNLRMGGFRRADRSRRALAQSVDRIYGYFPKLKERSRQLAGTLSGGEQQMCAIGRALVAQPKLLIIDELSLGLAPVIVEELLGTLSDIHRDGTTLLLVEQDVSVALGFSDRAVVLQAGRVVLQGPAAELLEDERIVGSYLGG